MANPLERPTSNSDCLVSESVFHPCPSVASPSARSATFMQLGPRLSPPANDVFEGGQLFDTHWTARM
jgi:hypothetical protein